MPFLKTVEVDLVDLLFVFSLTPKFSRFGMFGRPSAPKAKYYASLGRIFVLLVNHKYAKAAFSKIFLFDLEIYFHLCKVYRFQDLVGLDHGRNAP